MTDLDVYVNIMGGLGNQLFQIASAYSYARKNNGNLRIPKIRKDQNIGRKVYWNSLLKRLEPYLIDNIGNIGNVGNNIENIKNIENSSIEESRVNYLEEEVRSIKNWKSSEEKSSQKEEKKRP